MPNNNQTAIEYHKIKCFLYKYNPPFTKQAVQESTLATFSAYSTLLDDTKYFTKYDISSFVASYSFEQEIDETTYAWSVELQDLPLSLPAIDKLKTQDLPLTKLADLGKFTGLSFAGDIVHSVQNLAASETNSDSTTGNQNTIASAKQQRGVVKSGLTPQTPISGTPTTTPGLRLSDLIQENDFVSVFLYKNTTPFEQVTGTLVNQNGVWVLTNITSTDAELTQTIPESYLQNETVLLSDNGGSPLFSNELNGFVTRKTLNRTVDQVDRVILTGNGWTRLFGSTRRVMKGSLFQESLYQIGQVTDADSLAPFQSVYAGKTIASILVDLFDLVYRIDFQTGENQIDTGPNQLVSGSYFNISSMLVGNTYPANLFTVPQYLLASVMKRRNFSYLTPTNPTSFISTAPSLILDQVDGFEVTPEDFRTIVPTLGAQTASFNGTQPVNFGTDVQSLQSYFQFLDEVYKDFSPDLKTPYEIINEIRSITFVEFFESQNGQFNIRSPRYNSTDFGDIIFSSDLNVVTTTYSSTIENEITKLFTGFSANFLPTIPGLESFAYCDGKLLMQYGLLESATNANPNINVEKSTDDTINQQKRNGLTEYARYMLRILDARLKTGVITCDLDTSVAVGMTYYDSTNFRFGYITRLSKEVHVAGTATMTIGLSYVRDAVQAQDGTLSFQAIPVLTDIENGFQGTL